MGTESQLASKQINQSFPTAAVLSATGYGWPSRPLNAWRQTPGPSRVTGGKIRIPNEVSATTGSALVIDNPSSPVGAGAAAQKRSSMSEQTMIDEMSRFEQLTADLKIPGGDLSVPQQFEYADRRL